MNRSGQVAVQEKRKRTSGENELEALIKTATTISALRKLAAGCRACPLWKNATQTVFGEGHAGGIMLVGEQPGDTEDRDGHPFVGPAGKVLNQALEQAGIDRSAVYVTNAVKHFKWSPAERGKRRIHKKPSASETQACRPWLEAEIRAIRPDVLVCLGATAAQSLLGRNFSVLRDRGKPVSSTLVPAVVATVHPSSILRSPDSDSRQEQMEALVKDLKAVAALHKKLAKASPVDSAVDL